MMDKEKFRQNVYDRFDEYQKKKAQSRRRAVKYGVSVFSLLVVLAVAAIPISTLFSFGRKYEAANDAQARYNEIDASKNSMGDKSDYLITEGTAHEDMPSEDGIENATDRTAYAPESPNVCASTKAATAAPTGAVITEPATDPDVEKTERTEASETATGTEAATTPFAEGTESPKQITHQDPEQLEGNITVYGSYAVENIFVASDVDEVYQCFCEEIKSGTEICEKEYCSDSENEIILSFITSGGAGMGYSFADNAEHFEMNITPSDKKTLYIIHLGAHTEKNIFFYIDKQQEERK